ncbi:sigma-54-dependent Fis family transcriptional regulator [Vibrio gallaecicus]|nr:sigma-54-dependent Fis family transcriptional regulator [Vibrio gallaecicus]MDN3616051.1 sigma-54-dependent Fis family transcriptional regulator [Vibrio gallaecicus]
MQLQQSKTSLKHTSTSDWLSSSWGRSSEAGLKQRRLPEDIRLPQSLLKERRYGSANLIQIVKQVALPLFNQMFARSDSRLILTDVEGVILASWGQEKFKEKLTTIALSSGACWQEQLKGTNAIGTAIVEAKPVSIIGDQHFIHQHRFISCSACPIFDHQGQMIGILDITSEQQQHNSTVQLLVQNMIQLIENQLLSHIPQGTIRIDLAYEKSLLHSGWQGIVIADKTGQILAHNQVASQLLEQTSVVGESIESLFEKPFSESSFVFEKQQLQAPPKRTRALTMSCDLHHGDHHIEHVWQQANKVIDKDISLLILGETGVGKGEFVKALHKQSQRKSAPLVAVNCGALPKDLIESELFGYAPGAFTGASHKGYQGKIRQADKGILFLDEIADMPLEAQCRLLHVLQDKSVVPVGSNQSINVDCQIIAATHKNLEQLVESGEFRQDLYYRLNGLAFHLPSLKERDDKPALIKTIHQKYSEHNQTICPSLMERLCTYSWPGNIRELDNLLKVTALLSSGEPQLTLEHVPNHLAQHLKTAYTPEAAYHVSSPQHHTSQLKTPPTNGFMSEGTNLKAAVEDTLVQTYQANQGNISKTSRILGVSRNTIYRKLKTLGIL